MSPAHTLKEAVLVPIQTAIYTVFMLSVCALFSKISRHSYALGFPVLISTSPMPRHAHTTYLSVPFFPFVSFSASSLYSYLEFNLHANSLPHPPGHGQPFRRLDAQGAEAHDPGRSCKAPSLFSSSSISRRLFISPVGCGYLK